jgi:hypothetical protein
LVNSFQGLQGIENKVIMAAYSGNGTIGMIMNIQDLELYASQSRFPEDDISWLDPECVTPLRSAFHETEIVEGIDNQRYYIDETTLTERRFLPSSNDEDSLEPPKKDSLEPLKKDSLEPPKKDSLEPPKKDSLEPPKKDSLEPPKKDSLEPPKKDSLEPPKKDSLEPPKKDSLEPPKRKIIRKEPKKLSSLEDCFLNIYNKNKSSSKTTSSISFLDSMENQRHSSRDEMSFVKALNDIGIELKHLKLSPEQRSYVRELNVKISEIGQLLDSSLPKYIWLHGISLVWNCYMILEDCITGEILPFGLLPKDNQIHWIQKQESGNVTWNLEEISKLISYVHSPECKSKLSPETVYYQQQIKTLTKISLEDLKDLASDADISTVNSVGKSLKKNELIEKLIVYRFLRVF